MIALAAGMSPVVSRVPGICERGGFTGMSPVAGTDCDTMQDTVGNCGRRMQLVGALEALWRGGRCHPALLARGDRGVVSAVITRENRRCVRLTGFCDRKT